MTGRVAETLERYWLAFEIDQEYIESSKLRFEENAPLVVEPANLSPQLSITLSESDITELPLFKQASNYVQVSNS
jgi:site-specific DNA-methyltransferase (cytosine-N4-specific)